ncbi:IclR family transcriptional regulator [Ovoidimarina sediminis]|uniref:IclR family transcriptional regulator n=1 Tax=Ovoidimarina sediminis TaxID=3079856 RepID=UPI00290665A2|nr:IclR family transcriptional regulator [Rhodophyticola sp. MJ-SS7]MDU8942849.1 IclR family transcriptional regulator [Rhodophyticola sp. MJ-SS7]
MAKAAPDGGTVGKALEVLDRVAAYGRPVRFGELLENSPFPKASLYRFLQTLTGQGMLAYDPDRQTYAPGIRLVRLAHAAWQQSSLAPVARPHLDALSARIGETVHLAQLDNGHVLYVDKRNARDPIEMFSQAGKVGPAYCTGVGKAMLAHLDEEALDLALSMQSFHRFTEHTLTTRRALKDELKAIRERGHAYDREEHEPGIICIAKPILSRSGRVLGALSVTTSTERTDLQGLDRLAPDLTQTAEAIAREAESWQFPDQKLSPQSKGAA